MIHQISKNRPRPEDQPQARGEEKAPIPGAQNKPPTEEAFDDKQKTSGAQESEAQYLSLTNLQAK